MSKCFLLKYTLIQHILALIHLLGTQNLSMMLCGEIFRIFHDVTATLRYYRYSGYTQKKITHLCQKLCKSIKIKFAFSSPKACSYFSTKDKMPNTLRSSVVYKFTRANCNVSCVGETYRHFNVRIKEHLTSHSSNIFLHLKRNEICKSSCDESCFKVIDSDNSRFRLKIQEALHVIWLRPELLIYLFIQFRVLLTLLRSLTRAFWFTKLYNIN